MTLTIAGRIRLLVAAALLGLALLTGGAWLQMNRIFDAANFANVNTIPSLSDLGSADQHVAALGRQLWEFIDQPDPEARAALELSITQDLAGVVDALSKYEKEDMDEPREMYEKDKALLDDDRAALAGYAALKDQVLALARASAEPDARRLLSGHPDVLRRVADSLNLHEKFNIDYAQRAADAAAIMKVHAVMLFVAVAASSLLGLALLSALTTRAVVRPLRQAVAAADRIAAGDLTGEIRFRSRDEAGQVLEALKRMQDRLAEVVGVVRQNAQGVAGASTQIARDTRELGARTESAAASIEQTAAAMEQLSATVRINTDSAARANELAHGARDIARKGGAVVEQTVRTMEGIHDSSKRISEIISVIDGIAFQTNILALNAAVEAARAGEQGRGFAVVASEVRTLAQRSAAAAREIGALIADSVDRVASGSKLVNDSGLTMQEILAAVDRVADLMREISSAGREQSSGISQVGAAVQQMDQATQQNAALVQQNASASENLRQRAQALAQVTETFTL
jgi:methyl-accepting chemotaxis protein